MRLSVEPDAMGATSLPLTLAANSVATIDLAADLAPVAMALAGSASARVIADLGASWTSRIERLRAYTASQSGALTSAANGYAAAEDAIRGWLSTQRPS